MPPELAARRERRPFAAHLLGQNIGVLLVFALLAAAVLLYCVFFWIRQQSLPGNFELTSTVNNTMPLAMAAIGQTIVVLTRGLDLSVGGIIDLTNALAAVHIQDNAGSMLGWTALVLLVGAALGLVNGLLVGVGRLQPIVVTLATLSIFQGLAIRVLPQPGGAIPPSYTAALVDPNNPWALLYLGLCILLWLAFRRSALGVAIFAIGNDEGAARANGIKVVQSKVIAYTLSGVFAAAGGLFLAATATAGDATSGNGFTLSSIVAVVLGGVNLFGGRGSAVGAIAGAFVTTMIVNILFFSEIDPLYQSFYEGLFLIIAVVVGAVLGRLLRRRR
ncbi:MAG TPA: ABC transporter permease [Stellaceae bacterium]|nr:ABC transporter permease [Stellaceae bacterium]